MALFRPHGGRRDAAGDGRSALRRPAGMPACPAGRRRRCADGRRRLAISRRSRCRGSRAAPAIPAGPLPPTPSGYVPGAPIIATPELGEGLARLQAGEIGLRRRRRHARPVLRHPAGQAQRPARPAGVAARQEGEPARVDDHRAGRDAVRLHLRDHGPARRHQGAARAAADPGAEGGDARRRVLREEDRIRRALLVNALAEAGLGWSPAMGTNDPLYRKIDEIVHRILDDFTDDLAIFDELREDLEAFLAEEEKAAEANIQSTAEEINQSDRQADRRGGREGRDRAAHRARTRCRISSRRSCASTGSARSSTSTCSTARRARRGRRRRHARGPRLERAAEEDDARTAGTWSRCCRRC